MSDLETRFPQIPWREPIPIHVPDVGKGLGCRLCIAAYGLRGEDVPNLPQTEEEFATHMEQFHLSRVD
jgi:hypothetical protein